ncbi:ribosomal RNA small subunit methyltransferase A [bacterium]|nr:ribosomal RNA small subunit methyltransferase A [bacterium]
MVIKSFRGQNFVNDPNYIRNLVKKIDYKDRDIIEIGPGKGTLSSILLENCRNLISIELDKELCARLNSRFSDIENFHLHCRDFLKFSIPEPSDDKYLFIANVPYYISTPIIEKLICDSDKFEQYHMMLQYEYGSRLKSPPGSRVYGSLSVFFQNNFTVTGFQKVPKTVFTPIPKVDSCFVSFRNDIKHDVDDNFHRFIKALFSQRRKKLYNGLALYFNNISKSDIISKLKKEEINCEKRPEEFDLDSFIRIYDLLSGK